MNLETSRTVAQAWLAAALLLVAVPAAAQNAQDGDATSPAVSPAPLRAAPLAESVEIRLDGRIDEDAWAGAVPISDFTQQEPVEGGVPSERTEIRVLFDQDHLYIGAIVYDDPDGILAYQRQRDAGLNTDDRFMWILDTFQDGRTGYFFEINPAGLMGDGLLGGGGRGGGGPGGFGGGGGGGSNKAWDGIWEARTARRPDGWSAEIRIPFRTLNFDPNLDTWGINFQRTIRRRNEEILWRGFRRSQGLFRPIYAGQLTGLRNLSQGLGLEAVPSTIVSWRNVPSNDTIPGLDATTFPRDLSLDVNYSVTSSLRASMSINTDFAEVESDQRRVNLTRFPLRFPEQRDFFLEGSGVFSFASGSGPSPFYSRNVGLTSGEQIPITYGARMTGQVGAYEVGFYQIGTREHDYFSLGDGADRVIPGESFTVARVKRRVLEQSTIGVIYTRRGTSADTAGFVPDDRHTAGIDLDFNTRHFLGENNMDAEAFVVWNSNEDPAAARSFGDLSARGGRVSFPNDLWSGHVSYREFGDAYDPAVGFVERNGFRRVEPRVGWSPRPGGVEWLRKLDFSVQFRNMTELGTNTLLEREWQFGLLGVDFESGDGFDVNATRTYEFLDDTFTIGGLDILPGAYTTWDYRINGRTTGRRPISLFGGFSFGDFWDGTRTNMNGRITVRPNPGVSLSTNLQRNIVSLPGGDFTANAYELEGQWNPSPWVSWTGQLQYDNDSELLGLFARLRWIITPGNDLFLVYTHNWQNLGADLLSRDRRLVTLSRGGSVKLNYTYRF